MKRIMTLALVAAALLCGCKSEKKINSYSDIYSEKPTTVFLAPIYDRTERRVEKYPQDVEYNNALNTAAAFLYQTMPNPLLKRGYYVIGPVASKQIAASESRSNKQLRNGDLSDFNKKYGIDAMMMVTIHRWTESNGKWIVYLEYQLRSTKTNSDLMHTWVLATKEVPLNMKSDPIVMKTDKAYADSYKMDNQTAQRCFLVERVNDYILRDLPISVSLRQFEDDLYRTSNPTYLRYVWNEDGHAEVSPCPIEEYEQGCFLSE